MDHDSADISGEQISVEPPRPVPAGPVVVSVCISCKAAETGTIVMLSGHENPTTINFLPEHHIVVVDAGAIQGDLETVLADIRTHYGKGNMPRTVNLISGPSRSGDIEQKLVLGAHGPRALHLIVVGE